MSSLKFSGSLLLAAVSLCAQNVAEKPGAVRLEIRGSVLERDMTQGISGAEVTIYFKESDVGKVITDGQGAFRFQATNLGEYSLHVRKDGYSSTGGPPLTRPPAREVRITLDGDHPNREITFVLYRVGELSGRVVDADSGDPLTNFPIQIAQLTYYMGVPQMNPGPEVKAVTDQEGRFKATGLSANVYVAVVPSQAVGAPQFLKEFSEEDVKALDQDYERSYWPGGGGLDVAYGVPLSPGGFADFGTIRVRKTTLFRLHVSVPTTGCESGDVVQVMVANLTDRFASPGILGETACGKDFLIRSLQPGSYIFNLSLGRRRPKDVLAVEVKDRNISLTASLHQGADVEGQVILAEGTHGLALNRFQVSSRPVQGAPFLDEMRFVAPDSQGKFYLENLSFGRRRLVFASIDKSYYVKEVRFNNIAISDNIFNVTGAGPLQIVIEDKPATITGVVSDGDHPANRPHAVLARWPVSSSSETPIWAIGGEDGKFQFAGLAPGEYRIFAISQMDFRKVHEPGILNRLLTAAETISLGPRSFKNLSLKLTDPAR